MPANKPFGVWTLTLLVIANMVGAGVFTTSGFTLQDLGSPRLVIAAWLVGGLIALAGAASYGQLARVMPESGGEYLFLSRAAHPLLGFIAGWVSLVAGFTGAIAFAATALESYLLPTGARPDWLPADTVAVAVVIAGGVFHGLRPRFGAVFQNTAVLLKLGLLVGLLGFAASELSSDLWHGQPLDQAAPLHGWPLLAAFASALVWISLSYSGFNAAVYVADEVVDARGTVPKSLLLGTLIVTALYVLLNAVFVYAPPPEAIAGVPDIAAVAARWLGGSELAMLVRVIISAALLTSVSSMMMAAPRVYAKMADDGLLPRFVQFRDGIPRTAIALQVALAVLFILVASLRGLLTYLGLTLSLSAACSVGCLFLPAVRRRQPRFHLALLPPLVYLVGTLSAAMILSLREPRQLLATALTFSLGAAVYLLSTKRRPPMTDVGSDPISRA